MVKIPEAIVNPLKILKKSLMTLDDNLSTSCGEIETELSAILVQISLQD